jgi:hypothetical protein
MSFTPYGSAPGRECGSCTMCCKVYTFPEINKPAGVWCKFCNPGKGCKIHDNVPDPCRDFFCLWMTDGTMPDEWRPDRARFVLTIYPTNGFVYGQADLGSPGAWRRPPYYERLRDEDVPLGKMTAEDNFRIEPAFGPKGPTWRATRT